MAPQTKNKTPLTEFKNFIIAILKKRVFLFSLVLALVALFVQLTLSEFSLPQFYTFGFLFVGLAWSAYQAYRELSLKYQKALSETHPKDIRKSECSISFAHGHEYAYSLPDPFSGKNHLITKMQNTAGVKSHFNEKGVFFVNDKVYYLMGKASLEINMQILNSGDLPFDIFSVEVDHNLHLNHLQLIHEGLFLHGAEHNIPFHLESGELISLQVRYHISINRGSNEALFAADFRSLPRFIMHKILINTMDSDKNSKMHTAELKTPSQPLIDLYLKQWREYEQEEYLILAGYHKTNDP